ncbi:hypothetical protein [Xanthomonas cerealis]|nr:hypothetical protein [Xanthomonas translucens]UKE47062.1 hypothetical protein KHA79_18805 [Xanthomonas translucens pv. cerealis]
MSLQQEFQTQELMPLVPVDPVTAITITNGALDIAIKLKSLLGGGDDDSARILKELAIIRRQNEIIIKQLAAVLDILNNLGVIVRKAVRDEIVQLIKDRLSVALVRFYETYHVEVEHPELKEQATQKYAALRPTFADLGYLLATGRTYGYGHFHTVGLAMIVGDWLAMRLGDAPAFRRQALLTYIAYFEDALHPGEPGSIGAQLLSLRGQTDRLNTILDQADRKVADGFSRTFDQVKQERSKTYYYKVTEAAVGDRVKGYSVNRTETLVKTEFVGGQNAGGVGGGTHFMPDPVDTGDNSLKGRVSYWNAVSTALAVSQNDIRVLEAAKGACEFYIEHARTIR